MTPGNISNVELMQLAKKYIRPDLQWETFTLDEMLAILRAPRANCVMDATKLVTKLAEYGYKIKDRTAALEEVFSTMQKKGL